MTSLFLYENMVASPRKTRRNAMKETRIIKNAIRCKICGDIIESKSVHDFKYCSCGKCAVDGGHDYLRGCGNVEDWEDLSVCEEVEKDCNKGRSQ